MFARKMDANTEEIDGQSEKKNENEFQSVTEPSKRRKDVIYKPVLQKSNSFQSKRSGSETAPMLENSPADVEIPTYSERSLTLDSSVSSSNGQENRPELNKAIQPNEGDATSHTPKGHVQLKQTRAGRRVKPPVYLKEYV